MQKTRPLSYCIGLVMVVLFVYGLIRYPDLPPSANAPAAIAEGRDSPTQRQNTTPSKYGRRRYLSFGPSGCLHCFFCSAADLGFVCRACALAPAAALPDVLSSDLGR